MSRRSMVASHRHQLQGHGARIVGDVTEFAIAAVLAVWSVVHTDQCTRGQAPAPARLLVTPYRVRALIRS
jgi:hypothetical protein